MLTCCHQFSGLTHEWETRAFFCTGGVGVGVNMNVYFDFALDSILHLIRVVTDIYFLLVCCLD